MIVYMSRNLINGKVYIGKSYLTLEKRKNQHKINANKNRKGYFYNAIRKNGFSNFEWYILEDKITEDDLLNEMEFHYIKQFNSFGVGGYNLTWGGEGMSCIKGYKIENLYGTKKANEIKVKQSKSRKGKKLSKKLCKAISERQNGSGNSMYGKGYLISGKNNGMYGRNGDKNPFYNKCHTKDTKEKISIKSKNWWNNLTDKELSEYKLNMSNSLKGKNTGKQRVITCPYCNKTGGISNMKRYHFDNCKYKNNYN